MLGARLRTALVALCRVATGAAFLVLIGAVIAQVVGRSIIGSSLPWTEELTRYAMLWMVAAAGGLALRSGDLVNVDIVCEALPGRWPRVLRGLAALVTAALCAVLVMPAEHFARVGAMSTSPVLAVPMSYIHASVLALLALLAIFALIRALAVLLGGSEGRPQTDDAGTPQ